VAFLKIKKLLHNSIGLHADTVGESSIDRAISQRMHVTTCESPSAYYIYVKENDSELEELIEEVVVPETWFFRNVVPFEVLRDHAVKIHLNLSQLNKKNIDAHAVSVKILSLPCSSGEEPYSIAIALCEAGLKNNDFSIDAYDISKRAITKAKRAIYGKHSFREKGLFLQEKYFEKIKSGYRLLPNLCERVDFHQNNILSNKIGLVKENYDIIFCRNLLIYFDRKTQVEVLNKLSSALKPGGILFVGHAEAGQISKEGYTRIRAEKSFAFRKKECNEKHTNYGDGSNQPVIKLKDIYDQLVEVTKKDIELSKRINRPIQKLTKRTKRNINKTDEALLLVEETINTGHFQDAEKLCEEYLKVFPDSSDAYYYLGLISSLHGSDGGSESFLRKAIYLSPNNHRALSLLATLAEKRGDNDVAESFRRREFMAKNRGRSGEL